MYIDESHTHAHALYTHIYLFTYLIYHWFQFRMKSHNFLNDDNYPNKFTFFFPNSSRKYKFCEEKNTKYLSFWVCLILLNMMISSPICSFWKKELWFYLTYDWIKLQCAHMYHFSLYLCVHCHKGWFHSMAVVDILH